MAATISGYSVYTVHMDIKEITYTDEQGEQQSCWEYLMKDGDLGVPGGRYGSSTRDCADIAIMLFMIFVHANGEDSVDLLDGMMSMVVNSSDEVCWTVLDNAYALEGLTCTFSDGSVHPIDPRDYFDDEEIEYARELYTEAYCGEAPSF